MIKTIKTLFFIILCGSNVALAQGFGTPQWSDINLTFVDKGITSSGGIKYSGSKAVIESGFNLDSANKIFVQYEQERNISQEENIETQYIQRAVGLKYKSIFQYSTLSASTHLYVNSNLDMAGAISEHVSITGYRFSLGIEKNTRPAILDREDGGYNLYPYIRLIFNNKSFSDSNVYTFQDDNSTSVVLGANIKKSGFTFRTEIKNVLNQTGEIQEKDGKTYSAYEKFNQSAKKLTVGASYEFPLNDTSGVHFGANVYYGDNIPNRDVTLDIRTNF